MPLPSGPPIRVPRTPPTREIQMPREPAPRPEPTIDHDDDCPY
jgi:hypothetical protein